MNNLIKLMVIGMVIAFVLVGCNNNDEANETSENQETEDTNEASETAGEGETDEAEGDESASDETEKSSDSEGEILSLGETATMDTTVGVYEVTPNSYKFIESNGENSPSNGVYVVIDITIKNLSDSNLDSEGLAKAALFDSDDIISRNDNYYDFVENFEGDIAPEEEVSGQLLFDQSKTESYKLVFGFGLGTVSNEVTWEFTADEAE